MLDSFRKYLASPVFEQNEEQTRLAELLKAVVLTGLLVAVIYGFYVVIIYSNLILVLVGAGLVISLGLAVLFLMHRGYVKLSGALFSLTMWLISTVIALTTGGIRSPAFSSQMPVILVAGLLLGGRAGFGFAGLALLTGLGLLYAESNSLLPSPVIPVTSTLTWVSQTTNFIFVAAMLYLANRSINQALAQARRNEQAMVKSNRELQREIIERKQAEDALRISEERFRSIFENAVMGLYRSTPDGQIIMANPALVSMLGFSSFEELAQRNLEKSGYAPGYSRSAFKQVLEDEGQVVGFESVWVKRDDNKVSVRENSRAIRDAAGHTLYYEGTVEDITERKQVEAERERIIVELEAKNTELEHFTYTVSHDLRSPLVTIKGFLGLLEEDVTAGDMDRTRWDIEQIHDAADKMGLLLNDLLQLSRIGRLVNSPQVVQLSELAQEAVTLVTGQLTEREAQVEIEPNLPVVLGDRSRLLEVLQNLIDNAIKFMGDQLKPRIEIGGNQLDEEIICYVRDNGIGIEPRYHDKIFGLFERLDHSVEGTGIGLALVKRIIELHQGHVWVESEGKDQGSTFYFSLPQARQDMAQK